MRRSLTDGEQKELSTALQDAGSEKEIKALIGHQLASGDIPEYPMQESAVQDVLDTILQTPLPEEKPLNIHPLRRWYWAAAVLLLLGSGIYFVTRQPSKENITAQAKDIAPGRNGAILTLSDGSQIVLDSLRNGRIVSQQGSALTLQNGSLTYTPTGNMKGMMVYNTISTPKGRQFKVILPDETVVWLNAASSIRYPTQFAGHERKVFITGEACFEVAPDGNAPFFVNINQRAELQVLGTSFNINAYENEPQINTTLLSGSVKVIRGTQQAILRPGQQAAISQNISVIDDVNKEKIIAWKNGFFDFNEMDLHDAMRQIARWYEVEIIYTEQVPEQRLYGRISRDISLAGLIRGLNSTLGVDMQIRGGQLIIQPKK